MTLATLSLYRFDTMRQRAWALSRMALAHRGFRRVPGLRFYKLCGTGRDFRAPFQPNWSVFGVIAAWDAPSAADDAISRAPPFAAYAERAAEAAHLRLEPVWSKGRWSGSSPFGAEDAGRDAAASTLAPVAVLTRATIRSRKIGAFWSRAPRISQDIAQDGGVRFAIGLGEMPFRNQITFSIWPDLEAMRRFAYGSAAHAAAARDAFKDGWFSEDLFARFRVLGAEGSWAGRPAEAALLQPS